MAMPRMSGARMPRVCSSVPMNSPYSSAVCSRRLVRRQDARRRAPSNTPILVLVFPTSATSSMGPLLCPVSGDDLSGDHALHGAADDDQEGAVVVEILSDARHRVYRDAPAQRVAEDRKSTRLNSSHQIISYAVFCLKKKKKANNN